MKPAPFDYVRPAHLDGALRALAEAPDEVMALAGGQSLLPLLALRMTSVGKLVDVGRLAELREVNETDAHVMIGAGITHAEIEDGEVPDPGCGLMPRVAKRIAYRAVRNQGTVGGSVALADPAADWPVCLIALRARAHVVGPKGRRVVPVADLIEDIYTTSIARDELLVAFEIPRLHSAAKTGIAKVARKTGAFAMSHAIAVANDGANEARVVLGGAGKKAWQLPRASKLLHERERTDPIWRDAIAHDLSQAGDALDDYQVRLHTAVVKRAIAEVYSS
jgi:aerobic carbon-monoxide dehydrogenase medium subunit